MQSEYSNLTEYCLKTHFLIELYLMKENIYEIGLHLLPSITDKSAEKELAKVVDNLKNFGSEILGEEINEKRKLGYEISHGIDVPYEKINESHFCSIKFKALSENISKINQMLSVNDCILRFILFKTIEGNTRAPESVVKEAIQSNEKEDAGKPKRHKFIPKPENKDDTIKDEINQPSEKTQGDKGEVENKEKLEEVT